MNIGWARVHNTLYLGYIEGKQRAEIDDDNGDWQVTFDGKRIEGVQYKDLRDAKQAVFNMAIREFEE